MTQETGSFASAPIQLKRVLVNWSETNSSWNNYTTGTAWPGSAGCSTDNTDRSSTVSVEVAGFDLAPGRYYALSSAQLASDIEGFINGSLNNYGWAILNTTGDLYKKFSSSDATDGQRPYLSVTYSAATAIAPLAMSVTDATDADKTKKIYMTWDVG